ncbi:MAG: acyl-CoA dehydrogenase family protein [Candidatus Hydrogenedentes bacterium]|nr:acyl-CoA dehydrogenase family protein [Candidatus Hydrogenedentota bacterium]
MDLSFGEEYEEYRQTVRGFIEENAHLAPGRGQVNAEKTRAWQRLLIENGYAVRTIPKEYGGGGLEPDILKSRIIAEEFARAQLPAGMGGGGISFLAPVLLDKGTDELKKKFIAPTIRGEMTWCQGYSEPNAGSDLASLSTRAVLDGDEWVINGQKIWTSGAKSSDWMFCLVRTEPDAPKHRGISFLLLSMDSPGLDVRPLETMTGVPFFNEVFFTDVRVPKDQIIGQRGEGWAIANAILRHERDSLGDPDDSLRRLNLLIELMKQETVDGQRIIDNAVYRDQLMQIQGRIMALRFNDLRLLSAKMTGQDVALATMIVKLQGTELRHSLESLAIDALGEHGILYGEGPYLRNHGSWQHDYMQFLGLIIGGGTNQIQRNIISERGLGMPREPKAK